jgi:hypothetical protein
VRGPSCHLNGSVLSATYLAIEVPSYLWIRIFMYINERNAILLLMGAIIATAFIVTRPAQAETGKGDDVFRVIMTIFGVDKSKGDVVAVVTVNNGEASKVRFLDSDTAASGGIIEYVATFPNITVNAAEPYEACVLPVKTLEPICTTGNNSPAARPEFVDISLNATTAGLAENGLPEDVRGDEEG